MFMIFFLGSPSIFITNKNYIKEWKSKNYRKKENIYQNTVKQINKKKHTHPTLLPSTSRIMQTGNSLTTCISLHLEQLQSSQLQTYFSTLPSPFPSADATLLPDRRCPQTSVHFPSTTSVLTQAEKGRLEKSHVTSNAINKRTGLLLLRLHRKCKQPEGLTPRTMGLA